MAFELKVREFRPEDLGKLGFHLEALDRNVKKPHERPSIGVLLCATKDNEVVEYALRRTLSPTLLPSVIASRLERAPVINGFAECHPHQRHETPFAHAHSLFLNFRPHPLRF